MASKAERLRKAYEFKLGKDLAAKLTDSQIKILSQYYNSLSESEQSDIDNKISMGSTNDLIDMARGMAEENEQDVEEPPAPPEDELEPEGPSGAITLYEGVRETDLVDEDIDEMILRALGLEDVFDIDYGTYRTLLKEKMMADRMGQKMDAAEAQAVTEEYKRIKGKVGRFRIKKQKVTTEGIASPGGGNKGMKNFLALKGDAPEAPAQAAPTENFTKVNSILDEILATIKNLFNFERNNERKRQQEAARKKKQGREDKLESGSGIGKALKNIGKSILSPLQGPLDYILNWIKYTFLAKVVKGLLEWLANPANQGKIAAIGRFLKDWWPALVAAYLLFGNSISRSILKLTAILVKGAAKLLKVAIPKLMSLVARNPKAAAAVALFTAGATIPMLMPGTVDEQERKVEKAPGSKEDKIKQLKEQKANLNFMQQLQGVGSEIDEQIYKLETGETKSYESGGEVEDPTGIDPKKLLPFLGPLALPMMMADKGKDTIGSIKSAVEENPKLLMALGPMAFPLMMSMQSKKDRISTASNQKKDLARDITTDSGTDIKGAGVDTQLVPAQPGDIVMNKEAVDAIGPRTFDTIATNSGAKISGAGPDTQMIAARPGEVIINRETVNRVGAGYFLGLNKKFGGSNANKPKMAKVQTASGGGFVLPAFSSGGLLAPGEQRDETMTPESLGLPKGASEQEIKATYDAKHGEGSYEKKIKAKQSETGIKFDAKPSEPLIPSFSTEAMNLNLNVPKIDTGEMKSPFKAKVAEPAPDYDKMSIDQLNKYLDPTKTGASMPHVFKAAQDAKKKARASGLPEEEVQRLGQVAAVKAKMSAEKSATPMMPSFGESMKMDLGISAPQKKPEEQKKSPLQAIMNIISTMVPGAAPLMGMMQGVFGGGNGGKITEDSGMSIPGATADRQHIDAQPGEYMLPKQTVTAVGGPAALDKLVASTDSNSTPAKLAPASAKKPVPGPPMQEGQASMITLPPEIQSTGGGGGGKQTERQVPSFSATSPYSGERENNAAIYGIR